MSGAEYDTSSSSSSSEKVLLVVVVSGVPTPGQLGSSEARQAPVEEGREAGERGAGSGR